MLTTFTPIINVQTDLIDTRPTYLKVGAEINNYWISIENQNGGKSVKMSYYTQYLNKEDIIIYNFVSNWEMIHKR